MKKKTLTVPWYKRRKGKVGLIAASAVLLFFVMVIIHHSIYNNRLLVGMTIDNHKVGAMTNQQFDGYMSDVLSDSEIMISYKNQNVPLEISRDVTTSLIDDMWNHAYSKSFQGTWVIHMIRNAHSVFSDNTIALKDVPRDSFSAIELAYLYDTFGLPEVYQGKIAYAGDTIITEDSVPGAQIQTEELSLDILRVLLGNQDKEVTLVIENVEPFYDTEGINELVLSLGQMLETERTVRHNRFDSVVRVLKAEDLRKIIIAAYNFENDAFVIGFNDAELDKVAAEFRAQDAGLVIDDYQVRIDPGLNGIILDMEELRSTMRKNLPNTEASELVLEKGDLETPETIKRKYEEYNLRHVVSEFTTYHGAGGARVDNIHLVADLLDEKILAPGERLNMNEFLGERTLEKGYKAAGSIFKGELVDSVGGGISQLMTTMHNAVYWGGYKIISHKPHSIYFSRYPVGIEATINWPFVDYIFQNDTDGHIMIDTEYTDSSITIRILGDNNGRVFVGDHRGGTTYKNIVQKGGNARVVISNVSAPYNYREPLVRYEDDPSIARGNPVITKRGGYGWSVDVERRVMQGGKLVHIDNKPVHYFSDKDTVIKVHPCDNPQNFNAQCAIQ